MTCHLAAALRTLAALALLVALPALAGPAPRGRAHPDVSGAPERECAVCHGTTTPAIAAAWERSPHGVALVRCFVCHGSTGADFRARPDTSACRSCHAAQVASLAARRVKDCFACHAPHALSPNPHR
jgi:hypothetical protein